ncbi:MAG: SDR family oxidoreductase [Bifidobacteriaceae bacterium]|jgi:3alpha(or 20beta)-hydroxysteroid dehydrogenase|nr:SDR family oxidoreductase [Bifidobacteriaceae bacterium]
MTNRLDGKVAIVTGGASGMGASHARGIVAHGGKVVIGDISDDAGRQIAEELGDSAVYTHLDVTSPEDWAQAVELAEQTFGTLNVLVNNAGILNGGSLDEYTPESWDLVMAINAKGPFLGLKSCVGALRRGKPASVINISSAAGMQGVAGMHGYTASKYAVRGLTKSAALELAGQGIRVNSVHPGNIATPMTQAMIDQVGGPAAGDRDASLLVRPAEPAEVTALVVYLASDDASFSTGGEFLVDGGITAGSVY